MGEGEEPQRLLLSSETHRHLHRRRLVHLGRASPSSARALRQEDAAKTHPESIHGRRARIRGRIGEATAAAIPKVEGKTKTKAGTRAKIRGKARAKIREKARAK